MTTNDFKTYKDFPIDGINFIDINSILINPILLNELKDDILESINDCNVDKVVVIESRGFLFGQSISSYKNAGLVLARKPGKLPGNILRNTYDTEYSSDTIEMQIDSINKGDIVLIHDDIIATGGTILNVIEMVEKLGGIVKYVHSIGYIDGLTGKSDIENKDIKVITNFKF